MTAQFRRSTPTRRPRLGSNTLTVTAEKFRAQPIIDEYERRQVKGKGNEADDEASCADSSKKNGMTGQRQV